MNAAKVVELNGVKLPIDTVQEQWDTIQQMAKAGLEFLIINNDPYHKFRADIAYREWLVRRHLRQEGVLTLEHDRVVEWISIKMPRLDEIVREYTLRTEAWKTRSQQIKEAICFKDPRAAYRNFFDAACDQAAWEEVDATSDLATERVQQIEIDLDAKVQKQAASIISSEQSRRLFGPINYNFPSEGSQGSYGDD